MATESKRMGRPPVDLTPARIKALMRLNPTLEDTAAFFECHHKTIERYIKKEFDCTFVQFREQNMVHTRLELRRLAVSRAAKSDVMLIFCLKNLCGWANEPSPNEDDKDNKPMLAYGVGRARAKSTDSNGV